MCQLLPINVEITALNYLENLKWLYSTKVSLKYFCQCCFLSKTGISNIELKVLNA